MTEFEQYEGSAPAGPTGAKLPDPVALVCVLGWVALVPTLGLLLLEAVVLADDVSLSFGNEFLWAAGILVFLVVALTVGLRVTRLERSHRWLAAGGITGFIGIAAAYAVMRPTPPYNDPPPDSIWPAAISVEERTTVDSRDMGSQSVGRSNDNHYVLLHIDDDLGLADGCGQIRRALERYGWHTDGRRDDGPCVFGGSLGTNGGWGVAQPDDMFFFGVYSPWTRKPPDQVVVLVVF